MRHTRNAIKPKQSGFLFIDGRPDADMSHVIQAVVARSRVQSDECKRRKVNFLPKQVLRRIWSEQGLPDGILLKRLHRGPLP